MINLSYCERMSVIGTSAMVEGCPYLITLKIRCIKFNFELESALKGSYPRLHFYTM